MHRPVLWHLCNDPRKSTQETSFMYSLCKVALAGLTSAPSGCGHAIRKDPRNGQHTRDAGWFAGRDRPLRRNSPSRAHCAQAGPTKAAGTSAAERVALKRPFTGPRNRFWRGRLLGPPMAGSSSPEQGPDRVDGGEYPFQTVSDAGVLGLSHSGGHDAGPDLVRMGHRYPFACGVPYSLRGNVELHRNYCFARGRAGRTS